MSDRDSRLERVRRLVDEILRQQPDEEERRAGFLHLYGVAATCALLALRRGLDPDLCAAGGMLHDIWSYKFDPADHAVLGAEEAGKLLRQARGFSEEEILVVCRAIYHHSSKQETHDDMCELLKDADVLQHHLGNPLSSVSDGHSCRLTRIYEELGIAR